MSLADPRQAQAQGRRVGRGCLLRQRPGAGAGPRRRLRRRLDEDLGCQSFGNYARGWLHDHPKMGPRYRETCARNLRLHLKPLDDVPLRTITPTVVREWYAAAMRGSGGRASITQSYRFLRAVLNTAVRDGAIVRNPCQIPGAGSDRAKERPARAASVVSESASWEHRVAALDHPDEGLAAELEHLADKEVAGGHLVLAATHLRWASDISPARADRERRLLTAALHLPLADEPRGLALRPAVEEAAPSPLRSCVLGTMATSPGQLAEAVRWFSQALAQARDDPVGQPLAALVAGRLAGMYVTLGEGKRR
jgi:hypothetical protein